MRILWYNITKIVGNLFFKIGNIAHLDSWMWFFRNVCENGGFCMAELRVFISSTCYDLSLLRSQLRLFIRGLGYDPVMSDYEDIVYDPRTHTHTSCVDEVASCDILILIIGSRLGSEADINALNTIDFEAIKNESDCVTSLKEKGHLSVTQLEVLKAIESSIPVYTFIDKRVLHDHELYEKNKNSEIIDQIIFPSIEKQEAAKYIFNFINFVRLRTKNNNIFTFEKGQDIEEILRKQWSGYFKRLLQEQRITDNSHKKLDILSDQFEDLKTAILSSIENHDQRKTASGIVKYRRLTDFLFSLDFSTQELCSSFDSFSQLLAKRKIIQVLSASDIPELSGRYFISRSFLLKSDGTFFYTRISKDAIDEFGLDWESFKSIDPKSKEIILEALQEMYKPSELINYRNEQFNEFVQRRYQTRSY